MVDNNALRNGTVQLEESGDLLDRQRKPLAISIIQVISMVAIMVIGALANGVICHCILKHRSLRSVTNIFIMNLAATDFLLSILCMPFALVSSIMDDWIFGSVICSISGFILSMLCIVSILTLVLVAIDRYMAIKHPLKYCIYLTNRKSTFMLAFVWAEAGLCSLLPALGWGSGYAFIRHESICRPKFGTPSEDNGYTNFLFISSFVIPFTILATLYISILWTARKQFRQVHHGKMKQVINVHPMQTDTTYGKTKNTLFTVGPRATSELTSATNTAWSNRMNNSKNTVKRKRRKTRGFKMLLLIVVVFITCWSPHFILIFYSSIANVNISFAVKALTTWLTFLNSSLNPFLYGFLNGKFRSSLNKFLGDKLLCCGWWKMSEESQAFHINH